MSLYRENLMQHFYVVLPHDISVAAVCNVVCPFLAVVHGSVVENFMLHVLPLATFNCPFIVF